METEIKWVSAKIANDQYKTELITDTHTFLGARVKWRSRPGAITGRFSSRIACLLYGHNATDVC